MKVYGLIIEANPFHSGHNYLINQLNDDDLLIAISSNYFTQRGEISLLDKVEKTQVLLKHRVDLVVELPTIYTLNNADGFAYHAINILNQFKITHLIFGSEIIDLDLLNKVVDIETSSDYLDYLRLNQKTTSLKHLESEYLTKYFTNQEINTLVKPNNTLTISYLKAIRQINPSIIPHIIQRTNDYNEVNANLNHLNATTLREKLKNNEDISSFIDYQLTNTKINDYYNHLWLLFKYQITKTNINNEIVRYFKNKIQNNYQNIEEFINNSCNKKYSKAYILREIIKVILDIDNIKEDNYLRILGFNNRGREYLNKLTNKKLFFSSVKELNKITEYSISYYELKASELYQNIVSHNNLQEYTLPVRIERKD